MEWKLCLEQQLEPVLAAADSRVGLSTSTDLPFGIFLYPPEDEWELREAISHLTVRLENLGKTVQRISMAKLLEEALAMANFGVEELAEAEEFSGIELVQADIQGILGGKVKGSRPLDDLVAEKIDNSRDHTRHIVFLERVGALFGLHRPSALLENLHRKVLHPLVLFYPGQRDGPAGLRFMDAAEADHNYRPKLFS